MSLISGIGKLGKNSLFSRHTWWRAWSQIVLCLVASWRVLHAFVEKHKKWIEDIPDAMWGYHMDVEICRLRFVNPAQCSQNKSQVTVTFKGDMIIDKSHSRNYHPQHQDPLPTLRYRMPGSIFYHVAEVAIYRWVPASLWSFLSELPFKFWLWVKVV